LTRGILKATELSPILPTYLTFEALSWNPILADGQPKIGGYGLPLVTVTQFSMKPLPSFLEAPARYLASGVPKYRAKALYRTVRDSGLYDAQNKFYQTSVSLEAFDNEIGRIRAFTPGWLERESNFLHMTYKYLLGLFKAGLYEEFYREIQTNYPCFMDPAIYGRSPLENCSFLATSANPDPKKHGQGFVSRLSGSTAEMLSMWRLMFLGETLFTVENGELTFRLSPKIPQTFFLDGLVEVRLFNQTTVIYHLESPIDTYDSQSVIGRMTLHKTDEVVTVEGNKVVGQAAKDMRAGSVFQIDAYVSHLKEGKK